MSKTKDFPVFTTQAACEEFAKTLSPEDKGKKKVYGVSKPDGTTRWILSDGYAQAIYQILTKYDGYKVTVAAEPKKVSPEAAAAALKAAGLSEEQLRAMLGLSASTPPANPAPVVQPDAGNGRGRRSSQPA